jgi:hypothetical protein
LTTPPKVFLSYAHADSDKKFVSALHQRLKRDGIECFFDEVSLVPGDNFVLQISQAIDDCNYLIMVMSQSYFSARFAPLEWTAIASDGLTNVRGRLVPVLLEDCELPALIKPLSYIDVSSSEKFEQNYPRICQRVARSEPNDIEQRSKEIDDLFDQDRPDQAMKRLLDFARDFAKREIINNLTVIKRELEHLKKKSDPDESMKARIILHTMGLNLRDSIIDSLSSGVAR